MSHFLLYSSAFLLGPDLTRNLYLKVVHTLSNEAADINLRKRPGNYMGLTEAMVSVAPGIGLGAPLNVSNTLADFLI